MTWLVGLVAALGALRLLLWLRFGPARNELPDRALLARWLRLLVSRGIYKGRLKATLTLCVDANKRQRLVFEKRITEAGEAGVRADFPRVRWSEPFYEPFRAALARRGVRYRHVRVRTGRALAFDFGRDFGGALVVAQILFEEVMGLHLERDCVVYIRDVMMRNTPDVTGVDAPDDNWF